MVSLTGDRIPVVGACIVNICKIPTEVVVVETLAVDLLLGINLLHHCILDLPQKIMVIGDQKFPLTLQGNDNCSVHAANPVPLANDQVIDKVLQSYRDVFCSKGTPVNVAHGLTPAHIDTGDATPIKQQSYRIPLAKREVVEKCVNEMLDDGIIRPSSSPWSFPVTLTPKRSGEIRFCIDYRKLNSVTQKDAHPLPHIQDVFDQLRGATVFSTLDLKSGYWQVPMHEDSIQKTAFTCHMGLYEFVRLPFGLTNAPAIFQRAMNKALAGLTGKICMVYIDDIVVYSRTPAEHARHLEQVLQRLRSAGFQLKPSKCSFGLSEIELLGYKVSAEGIQPLPDRIASVQHLLPPATQKEVRSFLGTVGYYRQCIPNFATIALPLTELTRTKQPFVWGPPQQESFDKLKEALVSPEVMAHPDPKKPYTLHTDASDHSIGGVLSQKDDYGKERVIYYLSHKLSETQRRWSTIEKEAYAVIYALKKLHAYLHGAEFVIKTDHKPLKSLFQSEIKNTKLQRWAIQISEYGAEIQYHPGKLNVVADMLSRVAAVQPLVQLVPPEMVPDIWEADYIDPGELSRLQHEEFADFITEAKQETDETQFWYNEGLLYTFAPPVPNAPRYMRLLLPHRYREQVINRCHDEVGHAAAMKTLARIQEAYVWPGMRKHVRDYVSACTHCNSLTPPNPAHPRGRIPTPPTPFHTWGIDLVGPFKRDVRGRQYLLTCVDHLTNWAEAIPIASKKPATVQQAFMDNVVARYGIPSVVISDNGGEFTSHAFEKWMREFGIEHHLTSPYSPQSNGLTERFNATIQKLLLKLTGGNDRLWSTHIAEALYAYRTAEGPSGMSPYQAVYGKKARFPRSQPFDQTEGDRLRALRTAELALREFRDTARDKFKAGQPKRAKNFQPGTYVSVKTLSPTKGQSKWQTGYQVVSSHQGGLRLTELSTGRLIRVNQRNVRELPAQKPYDEIDPLPPRERKRASDMPPEKATPIGPPPKIAIPPRDPAEYTGAAPCTAADELEHVQVPEQPRDISAFSVRADETREAIHKRYRPSRRRRRQKTRNVPSRDEREETLTQGTQGHPDRCSHQEWSAWCNFVAATVRSNPVPGPVTPVRSYADVVRGITI